MNKGGFGISTCRPSRVRNVSIGVVEIRSARIRKHAHHALFLSAVQDRPAGEVAELDVHKALEPFELRKHLSANRTQGVPNMIALVKSTAERFAAAA